MLARMESFLHGIAVDLPRQFAVLKACCIVLQRADEEALAFRKEERQSINQRRLLHVAAKPVSLWGFCDVETDVARDNVIRSQHARGGVFFSRHAWPSLGALVAA